MDSFFPLATDGCQHKNWWWPWSRAVPREDFESNQRLSPFNEVFTTRGSELFGKHPVLVPAFPFFLFWGYCHCWRSLDWNPGAFTRLAGQSLNGTNISLLWVKRISSRWLKFQIGEVPKRRCTKGGKFVVGIRTSWINWDSTVESTSSKLSPVKGPKIWSLGKRVGWQKKPEKTWKFVIPQWQRGYPKTYNVHRSLSLKIHFTSSSSKFEASKDPPETQDAVISCEGLRNLTVDGQSFGLALLGMILGVGVLVKKGLSECRKSMTLQFWFLPWELEPVLGIFGNSRKFITFSRESWRSITLKWKIGGATFFGLVIDYFGWWSSHGTWKWVGVIAIWGIANILRSQEKLQHRMMDSYVNTWRI